MTKADIIDFLFEKTRLLGDRGELTKKDAAGYVELVFDAMKEALERGDEIKISGFGKFVAREKKPRIGRNPQTGRSIQISARRVLTFRPSHLLRDALNEERASKKSADSQ